ncbi:hypothetical protein ZEAMMB73_Zm00001d050033 [Zea mays]|uniref:Cardiolipin synthase N-terminal domain-containing protein n=1 Tax=Zea mays TaxID=4577 RepID=A0A1D6PZH0_MAIZE|nr:hypothetical protein ZEAMMB73_Zm00001d050033 [Zea mays]
MSTTAMLGAMAPGPEHIQGPLDPVDEPGTVEQLAPSTEDSIAVTSIPSTNLPLLTWEEDRLGAAVVPDIVSNQGIPHPVERHSSKSKIPVWPFLVLSCIGGAYALIPYFVLWKPPPPPIDEDEIGQWPLKFLESKLTAGLVFALGIGLIIYAGKAGGDDWKEFIRYFRESKFIHATCLDFTLLSAFSPFWVYNDMTARRWKNGSWLLPLALIPFVGPSLYLLLRPSLSSLLEASASASDEFKK